MDILRLIQINNHKRNDYVLMKGGKCVNFSIEHLFPSYVEYTHVCRSKYVHRYEDLYVHKHEDGL